MEKSEVANLKIEIANLEKASTYKTEVISISAHELRTSLTALKWILGMFLDGDTGELTDKQRKFIEKSLERVERMIRLSQEMLLINHNQADDLSYDWKMLDLGEILDGVLFDFQGEFHKNNIELVFLEPREPMSKIRGDADKVRVVIQNLLENSIKYTPAGGRVIVSLSKHGDMAELSVQDSGIGIPESDATNLFTKFYRGDLAKKTHAFGSGLGLYTAKKILAAHQGNIWFERNTDKGVTFFISLPLS